MAPSMSENGKKLHTEMPRISVIIPIYNVEPYLCECLDSVVNQTLREIEIICVNDGSTDNSGAILTEYAARDERITVITQMNRGLSAARNVGMDVAKGEYIYFIDSDDYIDLDTLEVLYNRTEELALDVLMFDYVRFDSETRQIVSKLERKDYLGIYTGAMFSKMLRDDRSYWMGVWNVLINREFLAESGIRFYEGIIYEDNLFIARLLLSAERVSHTKQAIYHWRYRANSITTKPWSAENLYGITITIYEMLKYGIEHSDEALRALETWKTIEACQDFAKGIFKSIDEKERDLVDFENSFIQYMYQYCVAAPAQRDMRSDALEIENRYLTSEVAHLQSAMASINEKISTTEQSAAAAWQEVENIRRSATYRIGRVITWIPRMVRGFARCYREHGWRYTWQRVVAHIGGE